MNRCSMKLSTLVLSVGILLLTGCNTIKSIYHWGNYSETLYQYTKTPTNESRAAHKAELNNIISKAQSDSKKVPPGIHFELAMLEANGGDQQIARVHFATERELFPESAKTVALALKEMEAK